tara:strand:+ start:215 stop:1132 length:918 start_codon:yes stop_codon:yes gene_type:complete
LIKTKEVKAGLATCRSVAKKANANFFYASQILKTPRREFFYATYAAMRVIDDLIDEKFLKLDSKSRNKLKTSFERKLAIWLQQVLHLEVVDGPLSPGIIYALKYTVGRSDLTKSVWSDLAASLAMDIKGADMNSWDDFLKYCDGATVAPASIYIYLLAATHTKEKHFEYQMPHELSYYARDLAIYCYIVHIIRDLIKDAIASPKLITIPNELLFENDLSRLTLSSSLKNKDPAIVNLANDLIRRAEPFYRNGHEVLIELNNLLGFSEKTALNKLINVYDRLYRVAQENVQILIERGQGLEEKFRT